MGVRKGWNVGRGDLAPDVIPDTPGATTFCLSTEDWEKGSEARKGKNRKRKERGRSEEEREGGREVREKGIVG